MGAVCSKGGPADDGVRVLWSGHMTAGHEQARKQWLEPTKEEEKDCKTKASMPPFNNANKLPIPSYVEVVNAPAFGPNIASAVMRIFKLPDMEKVAKQLGVPLPTNTLSRFVQDKMPKVLDMIKYAKEDEDLSSRMKEPIERLEKFVIEFEKLTPEQIKGPVEWQNFVNNHVAEGWGSKLHFDHLLNNFGFDKGSSDKLRAVEFTKSDGEKVTFEQHAFRWLSKAFGAYGPEGALTDVVNAVFAITGKQFKDQSDVDIAKMIDEFREKTIERKKWSGLWIPTHFFHDAEGDDCMVWVLLTYIRNAAFPNKKLKVLVQLPKELTELKATLEKVEVVECAVWLDPDSRNLKAVKATFKI